MKKTAIPGLALFLSLAGAAHGQTTALNSADVLANVQAGLTLSVSGATDFGTVNANQGTATISPSVPATGTTTAMFTATGQANQGLLVTFAPAVTLSNASLATMNFAPAVATSGISSSIASQGTATPLTSGVTAALNATGNRFFWLGGTLTISPSQPAGAYAGTFTLNVAY